MSINFAEAETITRECRESLSEFKDYLDKKDLLLAELKSGRSLLMKAIKDQEEVLRDQEEAIEENKAIDRARRIAAEEAEEERERKERARRRAKEAREDREAREDLYNDLCNIEVFMAMHEYQKGNYIRE